MQIINFYGLNKYVQNIIFASNDNKYIDIEKKIGVEKSKIILFEDNQTAIEDAKQNGVKDNQIICITDDTLKVHQIESNEYLSKQTLAFYSFYYRGYGKMYNPDFINNLKNQFANYSPEKLKSAYMNLLRVVVRDFLYITNILTNECLTVVCIPRSKAEDEYIPNQQLFRTGIQQAVKYLHEKKGIGLLDGTHYISRHTNTKTTHLSKSPLINNDGRMPYVGITKDTCEINPNVKNRDILLVDDIYTKTINIDEDAIQALYDAGAKSVTFYSVCKTL